MLQYVTIHRIALGTCIFFCHTCLNNAWSMSQLSNLSISWIAPSLFAISPMQVPDLGQVLDFQPQITRRCGIFKDDYLMVMAQIIRRSSIFKDHYLWWLSKNVPWIMFPSGSCGLITIMGICKYVSSICLALLPFFFPSFSSWLCINCYREYSSSEPDVSWIHLLVLITCICWCLVIVYSCHITDVTITVLSTGFPKIFQQKLGIVSLYPWNIER